MLKILGRKTSGNTQKVLWCCDELGIAYEREDVGRGFGKNHEPAYLALNPNGRVPTIVDDGFVLWESNAIVRYLCAKHGMGTLCPPELQRRADMERWMDCQQTTLRPHFHALSDALQNTVPPNDAALESLKKALDDAWKILDVQLAKQPFIAGDNLTMADIPFCYVINRWYKLPIEHRGLTNVVKLGGLGMTRCGFDWHTRDKPVGSEELAASMAPILTYCIEQFTPERSMFESNFPVDKVSFSYNVMYNAFKRFSKGYSATERAAMFHDTAARIYRIAR